MFPTDDQTLELLHAALHPGPGAERTSVGDLLELYGQMHGGRAYHSNDVIAALLAALRDLRAVAGPTELAVARGRREAYAVVRAELARELRGAPYNAAGRIQVTYVGGLARARRIVERLFRDALDAEERLVIDSVGGN